MKASELRIGNFIHIHGKLIEIQKEDFNFDEKFMTSIIITEKWLFKFGFKGTEGYYYDSEIGAIEFYYEGEILVCDIFDHRNENIKYIHQLQNIYFALTNKELRFN